MTRSSVRSACFALLLSCVLGPVPVQGQSLQVAPAPGGAAARPTASATPVAEGPTLDGDVLGDSIWQQATSITGFRQYQPDEGQPVSERTEVRMIFTRDTLYVGVVCYDSDRRPEPHPLRTIQIRRYIGQLYPGTASLVVEGPVCADGLVFWRVENSTIPGGSGWTAEGDGK